MENDSTESEGDLVCEGKWIFLEVDVCVEQSFDTFAGVLVWIV